MRGEIVGIERSSSKTNGVPIGRNHDALTKEIHQSFIRGVVAVQRSLRCARSEANNALTECQLKGSPSK